MKWNSFFLDKFDSVSAEASKNKATQISKMSTQEQAKPSEQATTPVRFAKVQECKNARHYTGKVSAQELERCNFWHDKDIDRWVVVGDRRIRWTPAWETEIRTRRRDARIAELKARPNYKTTACQHPDREDRSLHDHETCAFHHGYDFHQENAERIVKENAARRPYAPRRQEQQQDEQGVAQPPPQKPYDRRNFSYESEFPTLK